MWYAEARYYNPDLGRFAEEDPVKGNILDIQSLNLYPYVKNNPLKYIDPMGLTAELTQGEAEAWTGCKMFNSADEAAADFVMNNNPLTHADNKERGTYIYKVKIDGEVKYTYFESPPGGHDNVIINAITDYAVGLVVKVDGWDIDIGTVTPVAFVHTHPSCECHIGEKFSDPDIMLTKLPGISTVYLGTPNGMLYAYDKDTDSIRTVSSSMPKASEIFTNSKTK